MCLAVPGKIVEIRENQFGPMGRVSFGGVIKDVSLAYVPEAKVGDYVLVHTGFAISLVDEREAEQTWRLLQEIAAATAAEESQQA